METSAQIKCKYCGGVIEFGCPQQYINDCHAFTVAYVLIRKSYNFLLKLLFKVLLITEYNDDFHKTDMNNKQFAAELNSLLTMLDDKEKQYHKTDIELCNILLQLEKEITQNQQCIQKLLMPIKDQVNSIITSEAMVGCLEVNLYSECPIAKSFAFI